MQAIRQVAWRRVVVLVVACLGCSHPAPTGLRPPPPETVAVTPAGETRINPADGAEMVWIPAGEFLMGNEMQDITAFFEKLNVMQSLKGETPRHRVSVDGFWMYKYEVTNAQFEKFVKATGHKTDAENGGKSWVWNPLEEVKGADWRHPRGPGTSASGDHPVVQVSWNDAKAYCQWAGVQLPTEAQWEYAARGGNTGLGGKPRYTFWWGDDAPTRKVGNWFDVTAQKNRKTKSFNFPGYDDGYEFTSPVGTFEPNGFGLYDMDGNVCEWCQDWYDETYYARSESKNPRGPRNGKYRVLRGGSWFGTPNDMRVAQRDGFTPSERNNFVGIRAARTP